MKAKNRMDAAPLAVRAAQNVQRKNAGEVLTAWMRGMAGLAHASQLLATGDSVRLYSKDGTVLVATLAGRSGNGLLNLSVKRAGKTEKMEFLGETVGELGAFGFRVEGAGRTDLAASDPVMENAEEPAEGAGEEFFVPIDLSKLGSFPAEYEETGTETDVSESDGEFAEGQGAETVSRPRAKPLKDSQGAELVEFPAQTWGAETCGLELRPLSDITAAAVAKGARITLGTRPGFGLELESLRADGTRFRISELYATHYSEIGVGNVRFLGDRVVVSKLKRKGDGDYADANGTMAENRSADGSFEYRASGYVRVLPMPSETILRQTRRTKGSLEMVLDAQRPRLPVTERER